MMGAAFTEIEEVNMKLENDTEHEDKPEMKDEHAELEERSSKVMCVICVCVCVCV